MISQGIDIRSATASDAETVTDLLMAQFHEHGIGTPRDAVRKAADGMLVDHGRGFVLIAEQGSRIVGVAYVSFTWTLEHGGKSAWLEELYVVPDERNRGIGRAVLAAALRNAGGIEHGKGGGTGEGGCFFNCRGISRASVGVDMPSGVKSRELNGVDVLTPFSCVRGPAVDACALIASPSRRRTRYGVM
jgi:GNAT superfamily N-acetyltransferase